MGRDGGDNSPTTIEAPSEGGAGLDPFRIMAEGLMLKVAAKADSGIEGIFGTMQGLQQTTGTDLLMPVPSGPPHSFNGALAEKP